MIRDKHRLIMRNESNISALCVCVSTYAFVIEKFYRDDLKFNSINRNFFRHTFRGMIIVKLTLQ